MSPAPSQTGHGVVAYIHHTFPSRTATFVYREMEAVRDAGVEILNIACKRPKPDAVHVEARKYVGETIYLPGIAHPLLYVRAIGSFLRHPALFTRSGPASARRGRTRAARARIRRSRSRRLPRL